MSRDPAPGGVLLGLSGQAAADGTEAAPACSPPACLPHPGRCGTRPRAARLPDEERRVLGDWLREQSAVEVEDFVRRRVQPCAGHVWRHEVRAVAWEREERERPGADAAGAIRQVPAGVDCGYRRAAGLCEATGQRCVPRPRSDSHVRKASPQGYQDRCGRLLPGWPGQWFPWGWPRGPAPWATTGGSGGPRCRTSRRAYGAGLSGQPPRAAPKDALITGSWSESGPKMIESVPVRPDALP